MRNKLKRFEDNKKSENVIEPGKDIYENVKGLWKKKIFKNFNPITLEIGCGDGMYSIELARLFKDKNFIGIDIKGSRIWKGSEESLQENISNIKFLRTRVEDLEKFFENNEIEEIVIVFPDPRPKDSEENKRLTNIKFLKLYKNILRQKGKCTLKTDNLDLFHYTKHTLELNNMHIVNSSKDLYNSSIKTIHRDIQSKYEKKYIIEGKSIKFIEFIFEKK